MLEAGFSQIDITPSHFPVGTYMGTAEAALDPLGAHLAALRNRGEILLLASINVVILDPDVVARLVGQKLQESLKQPVVVEIKSGAGGSIASNAVAKAAPDGYSLVMLTGAHTVSAALRKSMPYDAVKDFAFLSTVSSFPFVVAVRAEHPARDLAELLAMGIGILASALPARQAARLDPLEALRSE